MIRRSAALHRCTLLLALLGVLYRGLIPAGFMPAVPAEAQRGAWLALCSGGTLKSLAAPGQPQAPAAHAYAECAFALAAVPALPAAAVRPTLPDSAPAETIAARSSSIVPAPLCARPPVRGPPLYS